MGVRQGSKPSLRGGHQSQQARTLWGCLSPWRMEVLVMRSRSPVSRQLAENHKGRENLCGFSGTCVWGLEPLCRVSGGPSGPDSASLVHSLHFTPEPEFGT